MGFEGYFRPGRLRIACRIGRIDEELLTMAVRPIVRLGHPALRSPAHEVTAETLAGEEFQRLIDDLVETMRDAGGVGLAAPQLGLPHQVFVYEVAADDADDGTGIPLCVMVNPMVEFEPGELVYDWEGCLSIPDLHGLVPRHPAVRVHATDRHGNPFELVAEGFEARVIQHEFDHLNGVVYIDRMRDLKSLAFGSEWEEFLAESDDDPPPPGR